MPSADAIDLFSVGTDQLITRLDPAAVMDMVSAATAIATKKGTGWSMKTAKIPTPTAITTCMRGGKEAWWCGAWRQVLDHVSMCVNVSWWGDATHHAPNTPVPHHATLRRTHTTPH